MLITFDLDDTLYLERDFVYSGFDAVGEYLQKTLHISNFSSEARQVFLSGGRREIFDRVFIKLGVSVGPNLIEECVEIYREHRPSLNLEGLVHELLEGLRPDHTLALVTDGFPRSQRNKIAALGIESQLDLIIVTGEHGVPWTKPSPLAFQQLERETGFSEGSCVYIGDNPIKDFDGPSLLGWQVLRFRPAGGVYSHLDTPARIPEVSFLGDFGSVLHL
jgi:putative hydrolase of the HAD superfamily